MKRTVVTLLWSALLLALVLSNADASHRVALLISEFPALTGGDCSTTAGSGAISCGSALLRSANNLSDVTTVATARTNLGLGTAATQNTGTSGANVPLLNGSNTWGNAQTFSGNLTLGGNVTIPSSGATAFANADSTASISIYGSASGAPSLLALSGVTVNFTPPASNGTLTFYNVPVGFAKLSAVPTTAPGGGRVTIFAVAGSTTGTCKLQVMAGTSTTPSTILDNIGAGC